MRLLDWLFGPWRRTRRNRSQELAELLAMETSDVAWSQIALRAGQLNSAPEAEGYIRVRTRDTLRQQFTRTADRCEPLSPSRQQHVLELAMRILVGRYSSRMLPPPPVTVPTRRAA